MKLPPLRLALGVGEPHEGRLLALLDDPACDLAGRGCQVTTFCSTVRELRAAIARTDAIDVVVMSSTLQALPSAMLEELVAIGRPLVVAVPDPAAPRWAELPVPVLGLDTDAAGLAAAIGDALQGRPARQPAPPAPASSAAAHTGRDAAPARGPPGRRRHRPLARSSPSAAPSCPRAGPPRSPCRWPTRSASLPRRCCWT